MEKNGKKGRRAPLVFDTTLGPETELKGALSWSGSLNIRGSFSGVIESGGQLCVDFGAECAAMTAHVESAIIAGHFCGGLKSSGLVAIGRGARIEGTVSAPAVRIAGGAAFSGDLDAGCIDPGIGPSRLD